MVDSGWTGVLPPRWRSVVEQMPEKELAEVEEIRLRLGRPLEWVSRGKSQFLNLQGGLSGRLSRIDPVTAEDCQRMLNLISHSSLYALEEELRQGYITLPGGHRVGLAGKAVLQAGSVKTLRDITCFNLRIAREVVGAANRAMSFLYDQQRDEICHTLILSPPQCGKTTLLRDIARQVSYGASPLRRGFKVSIVDERSEIAGCYMGQPQLDVGPRTDVLDSCPKVEGIFMMLRSMSPEVICVDEIGSVQDARALAEGIHAGVKVIATAHGSDLDDVLSRPSFRDDFFRQTFERILLLGRTKGTASLKQVLDSEHRILWKEVARE